MEELHSGTLYLCPTPIGNMEDMTFRAVRILKEVDLIAAEDTRHTGLLLSYFDIHKPLVSYHEHNKAEKGPELIALLQSGKSIAVVSDAGMPAISDPGADLVSLALEAELPIVPLPGANAALTALIASGLDTKEFTFYGFLPKRKNNRLEELKRLKDYEGTLIFYEAPHRLEEVLLHMADILGDRPLVIGRELTKKFETFTRTTLYAIKDNIESLMLKGEFVLLLGGKSTAPESVTVVEEVLTPEEEVFALMIKGLSKKEAIREIAKKRGLARRDVYNAVEAAEEKG